MDRCGLEAIVATHWVNVLYLSDFFIWIQPPFKKYMLKPGAGDAPLPIFAIFPRQGNPAIVIDQSCELNAADSWIQDRYVFGVPNCHEAPTEDESLSDPTSQMRFSRSRKRYDAALDALGACLTDRGLHDARLGIDLRPFPLEQHASLRAVFPQAALYDATELFRIMRMVKSKEELRLLRNAAIISENAAMRSLKTATFGCDIQEIVQSFRLAVAEGSADFDHFAFSRHGQGMATDVSWKLDQPDTMFIDFGCRYRHYYSDAGLTLTVGAPSPQDRTICRQLAECLEVARGAMKPGIYASDIQQKMSQRLNSFGLIGNFPHGHSIGIEIREHPILVPDEGQMLRDDCIDIATNLPLESDMVINLEAPMFALEGKAYQLEQTYVVTQSGAEPITTRALSEPIAID